MLGGGGYGTRKNLRVKVERLFSDAKHIMTEDRRHHMDPSTLEILRCDWYWNSQTIDDIINDEEGDAPAPVIGDKRQHADDDDEDDDSSGIDDYCC